jgi:hypothetical protein
MNGTARLFALLLVVTAGIFAAGCPQRTTIAEIERNPSRHVDKEVVITGVVKDSYGISIPGTNMRGGIYKVDDGTGSIWVMTENTVPAKGAEIGVRGTVGNGVSYKGRNYGLGMYEKDRRFSKK